MTAIATHNLTVHYPGRRDPAIRELTCTFQRGKITGLLGPNGAGKTTAVHAMTTVIPITSGDVIVLGHNARRNPTAVRSLIGLMSQVDAIDWALTIEQQIEFVARLLGFRPAERRARMDDLIHRFGLSDVRRSDPVQVSGGQLKRTQIVCCLLRRPEILFVDEPTLGLDPLGVDAVLAELRNLAAEGTTVILATNEMEQAAAVCDEVLFLRRGRMAIQGTPAKLAADYGGSLGQAFRTLALQEGDTGDSVTAG